MSAIEAVITTGFLVAFLGMGVGVVSAWRGQDGPFVAGAVLSGIGSLGFLVGMIWAVWAEVAW